MCGIVGVYYFDESRPCEENVIRCMRDIIRHRGPDDKGVYLDKNVGLGHRRLSIIDLGGGHQPMQDLQGRYTIVFNGEIYNFKQLRNQLEDKGYVFRTSSDTEVILNLYIDSGRECAKQLNGIFAFAIWDRVEKELYLARDHLGIKPLYYANTPTALVFSSEIKSLFYSDELRANCNKEAISEYFIFRQVAGERTLFEGVKSLLPGHYLTIKGGKIVIDQYWSAIKTDTNRIIGYDHAYDQLKELLSDAVKMQMMSDVPLGTFCSGGVDSSLVTALASKYASQPINTFSIGFNEKEFDESKYARMVSDRYGTHHHELVVEEKEFSDLLPRMIWHNDEPLNYANSVHIYALSKLAKESVTVVLTGEGADELFAGYPRYFIPSLVEKFQKYPRLFRSLLNIVSSLKDDHRIEKVKQYMDTPIDETILYNAASLDKNALFQLDRPWVNKEFSYRANVLSQLKDASDIINKVSQSDQCNYLVSILNRQDKMSMAASLESRVPFLDYRLVEFANSLPSKLKAKGFNAKKMVKQMALEYLPKEVVIRRKSGFGVPLAQWMKAENSLGERINDLPKDSFLIELFGDNYMRRIVADHKQGSTDHSDFLWNCLNISLWNKQLSQYDNA